MLHVSITSRSSYVPGSLKLSICNSHMVRPYNLHVHVSLPFLKTGKKVQYYSSSNTTYTCLKFWEQFGRWWGMGVGGYRGDGHGLLQGHCAVLACLGLSHRGPCPAPNAINTLMSRMYGHHKVIFISNVMMVSLYGCYVLAYPLTLTLMF